MRNMIARTCQTHQLDVPLDDHSFSNRWNADKAKTGRGLALIHLTISCQAGILTMLDHWLVEHIGVGKQPAHYQRVADACCRIGEGHRTSFCHQS